MNTYQRQRPLSALSGCGYLLLPASGLLFLVCLVFFLVWMANSPPWQARLYGSQTRGIVKSVSDDCNTNSTDPSLDPSMGGGFLLRSLLPLTKIEQDVLPTIEFTDSHGHRYDVQEDYCGDYGVGEQVTVWYLPAAPTTIALTQETDSSLLDVYLPLIGMGLALLAALGSGVLLVAGAVQRRRTASSEHMPGLNSFAGTAVSLGSASTFPWKKYDA